MRPKRVKNRKKTWRVLTAGTAFVLLAAGIAIWNTSDHATTSSAPAMQDQIEVPVTDAPGGKLVKEVIQDSKPIEYQLQGMEAEQKALMEDRKKKLGIQKSLDMIVTSEESIKVGGRTVSMQTILEKALTGQGKVFQQELTDEGARPAKIKDYGVYVVQPGDNLWNIHFGILKEYYAARGLTLSSRADEPGNSGRSSGVGKILKFSETMVIIYNMVEGKVVQDINLLEPLSKVVVYNMDAIFNLLREIDFDSVNRIEFDGKNIWLPAQSS